MRLDEVLALEEQSDSQPRSVCMASTTTANQLLKTQWPATLAVRKRLKKASDSERCRGVQAPLTVAGNVAR